MSAARKTPLFEEHRQLGARMVEFAGFDMPVHYTSIKQEHSAVRLSAGLFDVSHMGQIHFSGPQAVATVERLLSCRVASLGIGCVRYGLLCNDAGGCVDDVTVYREAEDALFLCVNASNIEKDHAWIDAHTPAGAGLSNRSDETGLLALQGPTSTAILSSLADGESAARLATLKRFRFARFELAGIRVLISNTGYTGAAGYEIYAAASETLPLFRALLETGAPQGLVPAGLGARDTLRLEAALPLYGHELDDTTSPLEAGLDRFVKRDEGGFIGAEAIESRCSAGHPRQLVGFEINGRGIPRADYPIAIAGEQVGRVTSGAPSPSLGKSIGLGYVPPADARVGAPLEVLIRGRAVPATIVATPFVAR